MLVMHHFTFQHLKQSLARGRLSVNGCCTNERRRRKQSKQNSSSRFVDDRSWGYREGLTTKGQHEGICGVGGVTELFWVPIVVVVRQLHVFVKTQNCTLKR